MTRVLFAPAQEEFAGGKLPLEFRLFNLLLANLVEVLIRMGGHHDCDVHGDLIGKSLVNQIERAMPAPLNILKNASFEHALATELATISPVVSIRSRQVAIAN